MEFELPQDLVQAKDDLKTGIRAYVRDARRDWEEQPGEWHGSPKAVFADTWLDGLDNLADELDNAKNTPE